VAVSFKFVTGRAILNINQLDPVPLLNTGRVYLKFCMIGNIILSYTKIKVYSHACCIVCDFFT
jgi:hypothetical protein